ncbi:MAG TPA: beta-propeller domain-containing protein, partial [Candidatus Thermoplasmatota archaeon]|nr:beta-propeller domain-containing protein [Candidatus Thermoplasmatota archaeon]
GSLEPVTTAPFGYAWGGELILERRDPADPKDDRLLVVLPGQSPPEDQPLAQKASGRTAGSGGVSMDMAYWGGGGMTRIVVLSLADRAAPRIEHEAWVDGTSAGTRLVDGAAHVVIQTWEQPLGLRTWVGPGEEDLRAANLTYSQYDALSDDSRREVREAIALRVDAENVRLLDEADLEEQLPTVLRSRFGFLIPEAVSDETCRGVLSLPQATGRAFTTIVSLGLSDAALPTKTLQVLGGSAIVYADSGALVLASPSQDPWWFWAQPDLEEATDLLWFDLAGIDVVPRASGRVVGTVLDSFSLDVHDGELRIATTVGQWGRTWLGGQVAPMVSQLVVFEEAAGALVPRGSVGGIAPGERIWSARFTDERAYLVTFRNMDPLWVVDLGDEVRILGELEIPGVSTYLHPLDDRTLLAIGYGPGAGGIDLDWSRVQVSLFDLSELDRPRRADVIDLSPANGYSWSGATQEHRAFTYWEAIGTLAVPMTTTIMRELPSSDPAYCCEYRHEQHIGLKLIDVDREALQLSLRGEVDQDILAQADSWGPGIERSWFLGYPDTGPVSVYSMSPLGVTAHDLFTLQRQAVVSFDPSRPAY